MDSTITGSVDDNINIDSTIAGSVNDKINMDSRIIVACPVLKKTLCYRVWVNGITHG